ncbi:TonB-dependent receptor plug domain-containing protein, partial [Klebsiella pneumoniae]|uniref:TonB-dependent receptor plug domain-containing protein n=1 Tax=Klebsiella pneumoniae TaxID=573 RepID=UPI001E408DAE
QQMADQGANTISQALEYTPGVYSSFGGGATRFDAISLRGYHGSLPLDGTRYAHNGRKLSPSTNEGDPGDGYQRRQQIYS